MIADFYERTNLWHKNCGKCKTEHTSETLEGLSEYFHLQKSQFDGLYVNCKSCKIKADSKYGHASQKRKKDPVKHKARTAVSNAIASGKLARKPCSVCGNEKSEAHHADYSKPLDVVWLCDWHHKEEHKRLKELV